jgi:hypothetical protein
MTCLVRDRVTRAYERYAPRSLNHYFLWKVNKYQPGEGSTAT